MKVFFSLLSAMTLSLFAHIQANQASSSLHSSTDIPSDSIRIQNANAWVDSVFNSLTDDQRIAQLMVVRESTVGPIYYTDEIKDLISKYNIGAICLFQGEPDVQAKLINEFQAMAQTPIMVTIDGEWGLGMRMSTVKPLKHNMMLGATNDAALAYQYGTLLGKQMKRMGIHVDYAPVVDINNNPLNPVINDRSLGENKHTVAKLGMAIVNGIQDQGIIATIKHFPGHGDVSVDSHLDLPVINKTLEQLDTLELYPFRKIIEGGVASVMIAHLNIPALDSTPHIASSISKPIVTGVLREKLGFKGLTFTDALEMKGVAKYFPGGEIDVRSLIAGNDMLCLPADVPTAIDAVKKAIQDGRLTWDDIYNKCRKVLQYKYKYNIYNTKPIKEHNLTKDLNKGVDELNHKIAEGAITLLNNQDDVFFPLRHKKKNKIAYVGVGIDEPNEFAHILKSDLKSDNFFIDYQAEKEKFDQLVAQLKNQYKAVVIGIHQYHRYPANRFGIPAEVSSFVQEVQDEVPTIVFAFGNPYGVQYFAEARNLVACYEDDPITQKVAAHLLMGKGHFKGTLSVSVSPQYPVGSGILHKASLMKKVTPEEVGMSSERLKAVDSILEKSVEKKAFPGVVVLAAKNGKIFYEKAFGNYNYGASDPISTQSIFDLASVTKILATTLSVMKLYDEGDIKLNATLGTYLPWVRGTNKQNLKIKDILLHQAGLIAYIPFYKKLIDSKTGVPLPEYFSHEKNSEYPVQVAGNLYLRGDYQDTIYQTIVDSKLSRRHKYIYSDNDFIFLGKIVEALSGMSLDDYATENFYRPMGLRSTGFLPRQKFDTSLIVPTEDEKTFRMQHLRGFVHDPGAALFGGIAGHAGLFSSAEDVAALLQMLLNGGKFGGKRYIKETTIRNFTAYNSKISRRGYGFDKPQKDNYTTKDKRPYPSRYASPFTYGHTGYTGTAIWVDPKYDLIYVFLSNRVNPNGGDSREIYHLNTRGAVEDSLYKAMIPIPKEVLKREGI